MDELMRRLIRYVRISVEETSRSWLEGEAKTDRAFATERRQAAAVIGKGWREAAQAIASHERFLGDLKTNC